MNDLPCCVEYSKSNRSQCKGCYAKLDKGELRIGQQYDPDHSGYIYYHLRCFNNFPKHTGISAKDFLFGYEQLSPADQKRVSLALEGQGAKQGAKEEAESVEEEKENCKPSYAKKAPAKKSALKKPAAKAKKVISSEDEEDDDEEASSDEESSEDGSASESESEEEKPKRRSPNVPKRDPNAPKKGLSAFMFFSNDKRDEVKKKYPDAPFCEIGKQLGMMWKNFSDAERAKYEAQAAGDKQRYLQEMEEYTSSSNAPKKTTVSFGSFTTATPTSAFTESVTQHSYALPDTAGFTSYSAAASTFTDSYYGGAALSTAPISYSLPTSSSPLRSGWVQPSSSNFYSPPSPSPAAAAPSTFGGSGWSSSSTNTVSNSSLADVLPDLLRFGQLSMAQTNWLRSAPPEATPAINAAMTAYGIDHDAEDLSDTLYRVWQCFGATATAY